LGSDKLQVSNNLEEEEEEKNNNNNNNFNKTYLST
jgi:hypothetical protein